MFHKLLVGGKGRLGSSGTTVTRRSLYRDLSRVINDFPIREIERESLLSSRGAEREICTSTATLLPQSSAEIREQVLEDDPREQLELSVPQYEPEEWEHVVVHEMSGVRSLLETGVRNVAWRQAKFPIGIEQVRDKKNLSVHQRSLTSSNETSPFDTPLCDNESQSCVAQDCNPVYEAIQPCDHRLSPVSEFTRSCLQTLDTTLCIAKVPRCASNAQPIKQSCATLRVPLPCHLLHDYTVGCLSAKGASSRTRIFA